jgi:dTDP-4-dehydrorhamnose reductase
MKILLAGRSGQIGWELHRRLSLLHHVTACDRTQLDICDPSSIARVVREVRPDVVVNAAAYTAVDKAESDLDAARAANAVAPGVFAEEAKKIGARLVHYSTDYVFDGKKPAPYVEEDATNPLNVYGRTKLEGENAVKSAGCAYLILRTCWIFAPRGANFCLTILRLAKEREELRIVDDQIGTPTTAAMVADKTVHAVEQFPEVTGLYHLAAAGRASWHTFAQAIVERAGLPTRVLQIPSSQYPTPARRPANSVLDCSRFARDFQTKLPDWHTGLESTVHAILHPTPST